MEGERKKRETHTHTREIKRVKKKKQGQAARKTSRLPLSLSFCQSATKGWITSTKLLFSFVRSLPPPLALLLSFLPLSVAGHLHLCAHLSDRIALFLSLPFPSCLGPLPFYQSTIVTSHCSLSPYFELNDTLSSAPSRQTIFPHYALTYGYQGDCRSKF